MVNAIVDVGFSLDIPEEKVAAIIKDAEIEETESQRGYEAACKAIEEWAQDNWVDRLDWMTAGEPEVEVTA